MNSLAIAYTDVITQILFVLLLEWNQLYLRIQIFLIDFITWK